MALPPGFVLEEPPSGGQQPTDLGLPPGFQLETPGQVPPPPPEGGFINALQRGALQTGSLIFDVLPGMAARLVGANEYAERQFKEAAETEKKIQERYAAAVPSYKDITGLGTGLTYFVESVGELVPSILPSLFTGGVAGVVGRGAIIAAKEAAEKAAQKQIAERGVQALTEKEVADQIRKAGIDAATKTAIKYQGIGAIGGSSLQNVPEVFQNIKEETGEESIGTALLFGGFNSVLDAALPLSLMIKARKAGIPNNELAAEWYKRFGKGALKGFATEGATEAAQEMSSAAAAKFVDNNIDFFSEKNFERFINAGLKGGLGGGVVSGATDVVLGKKPLTEAERSLDEDIRNTQSDILARRALLDELRAQSVEEGRNRLDPQALKDLGFGTKYSLYDSLLNKDINDPAQAQEVLSLLQAAIDAPETKGRERVVAANTLDVVNQYLSSVGDLDVGQVITEPVGAGISVPATPVEPTVTEGVGGVERTGVAPVVPDVGAPVVGEELAPAPVAPPVEPIAEPALVEAAPVEPALVEAAPVEAAIPTTRELIAEQEAAVAAQMERFQGLLKQQIDRFGLKDVAVRVVDDMQNANAQYTKGLITLALDAADPVRDLRHESVHALKELGFFSPAQWQALVRRANESWINTYLKNRDIDGNFIEPGKESRYDAYIKLFKQQGLDEAQTQEALIEEAISDAFGDFNLTKAPPGMMQAILNRMKNFFRAIKETVTGSGVVDPEEIFGKIEKAEIAAPAKPKSEVAAPQEKRTAPEEAVPTPERKADEAAEPRAEPRFTIKQVPTAGRPEPSRDRGGRDQGRSLAPLAGAPIVPNATGPDANLVRVAEEYAERNGIPLERQPEYVEVDEDRARRIAQAYEDMPHAPRDPKVREAYADLIRQTRAQYDALIDDGYEFTFFDGNTDPYGGNPFNAMRDLRQNKRMAVYGTYDGYGTDGITGAAIEDNPMLADTGLRWKDQGGVEHMVTANDLFRAVHDAFGHGLEGAGFRARGEENAWQAHARLFTEPALHALTSETRGQNSWLNFGPYGEKNRTAKLEDTVFAEQKTGLMPDWTWQEGLTIERPKPSEAPTKFSLRIMEGKVEPDIDGKVTVNKIGKYFDDRVKEEFGGPLDYNNPEDFARAVKIANEEVGFQLKQEKSGLDWYEDDVRLAFEDTAKVIKQLKKPGDQMLFSVIAGIMSPKTTARDNWYIAAKAYEHYINTKTIPGLNPANGKLWAGGPSAVNKRIQLEFLDRMVKDIGQDAAVRWLMADHTVREINEFRRKYGNIKSGIDGKLGDIRPGLYAFGPKIGPFVSNINGIFDVTVDQWMTRTFNRYFGTMLGPDGAIIDAPPEPQRRAIKDLINKVAEDASLKPYQVQSLLWFYEQRLYDKIGVPTKSYGFSDGGRKFLEEARGRGGAAGVPIPAKAARPKQVTPTAVPKYSISGKRITDTPELRAAAEKSAIVDKDGNLIPMYHGTAALIRIFRPRQAGATFVSPSPNFASGFTSTSRLWMVRHIGQFLKPDEIKKAVQELRQTVYDSYGKQSKKTRDFMDEIYEVLQEAKETGFYNFQGELEDNWYQIAFNMIPEGKERVMELYVLANNPFDFEKKDDVNKVIKRMLLDPEVKKQYGYEIAPKGVDIFKPENFMLRQTLERNDKEYKAAVEAKFKDNLSRGRWTAIEMPEAQRAIRGLGFDSFYVFEGGVKNLGVYDPKLIKSADENFGPFGQRPPTEEEARAADMTPEEALKAQSEGDIRFSLRSPIGLYSELENKIEDVSAKAAPAPQWKAMIKALPQKGVKPEEIEWSGVNDWLDLQQGRVTKDALLEYLKQGGVQVEETVLGGRESWRVELDLLENRGRINLNQQERDRYDALMDRRRKEGLPADETPAKFQDYTLPGGENYREVLLRLPSGIIGADAARLKELAVLIDEKTAGYGALSEDERRAVRAEIKPLREERDAIEERRKRYRSTHWEQPNVLAHIRVNDRTDADGNKVLFVEEIQSDWGQEGKKKGFEKKATNALTGKITEHKSEFGFSTEWDVEWSDGSFSGGYGSREAAEQRLAQGKTDAQSGLPAAPFVTKTEGWLNLALKRIMVMAAEGGYDKVAFVNGEQSADRYDLSKQVNRVRVYRPQLDEDVFGSWIIQAEDSRGNNAVEKDLGSLSEVEDYVGKEVAQRLITKLGDGNDASLSGLDLKVGGEGMKTFYDQIVPLAVKKLLPKVGGGQMEVVGLGGLRAVTDEGVWRVLDDNLGGYVGPDAFKSKDAADQWIANKQTSSKDAGVQPGFDVTPAMREKVATTGLPKFSLRSTIDPAINARILQTTTQREEASFPERITDAIGPRSRSEFRAAALNRYNRMGDLDKMKQARMGGAELLADSNAESAALLSDLAAGIVAGALGVYDGVGGVPVYKHHYVVERTIMGPRGPQIVMVGGKIQSRQAAEALARRYPNSKVKERGFTAVSNLNNTIEGPLKIFTDLAKVGDPYAYRAYQFWAGVKRGSKWMTVTQGPQKGQVVEQLFEPADIQKAEKLRQEFKQKYKIDFEKIQKEWIKYNDELVQYALDTGVISKENAKKFKDHGDYIPFYRQINGEDDAVGPRIFQSISAVQAPRKIKGGEDPLGDFLENVVRNTQSIVQAGLKNVAGRRAAEVGMDLGFVSQINQSQASPVNSFYVLEEGKKVYYDTSDVLLMDSIKSLGMPEIPLIGILAGPANTLRNLVTKDPGFMLANMMRDSLAAWTTSGVNMVPIAATLKNFANALANTSPEYKSLLMGGVVGGYDYSQGTKDAAKQFGKELRRAAGAKTLGEKALTPFTSVWEGLEKGTQASDAATRIEVYKQTLKDTGNEAEALFRALEVMNFNRKGNNPIVRVATAAIPFLNARMQGLDVLYRAGLGKNATANAKEIQKAFWRRGMYMAALSTMYWMLTHDDEDYKKQEQETKDNNWLFPSLGIKIPIPFEIGVLFKVIPERIAALTFGDDTAKDFTKSMVRNLTNTLAFNPIPQTFVPIVEAVTNYDFFTMRPIVGQGLEGVAPEYQIGARTSRLGETLGKAIGVSPMKVDQIIQGYTGTIGQYMSDLIDSVYDLHTDNPKASKRFEQMPVFKRFAIDPEARGQVTAYFDLKNAVDEATRTANLLERTMNFEEWGKYYTENIGLFAVKDYVLDMDKTLKEYREMRETFRSLPMDADTKRDNIRAINQIENALVSNIQMLKNNMIK